MDSEGLSQLLSPDGWALLSALPPYDETRTMALSERLRDEGVDPVLVAAALTQSRLRAKAPAKFGDFAGRHAVHGRRPRAGHAAHRRRAPRPAVPRRRQHAGRGPDLRDRCGRDGVRGRRAARARHRRRRGDGRHRHREPAALPRGRGAARRRARARPRGARASTACTPTRHVGPRREAACSTPPPTSRRSTRCWRCASGSRRSGSSSGRGSPTRPCRWTRTPSGSRWTVTSSRWACGSGPLAPEGPGRSALVLRDGAGDTSWRSRPGRHLPAADGCGRRLPVRARRRGHPGGAGGRAGRPGARAAASTRRSRT